MVTQLGTSTNGNATGAIQPTLDRNWDRNGGYLYQFWDSGRIFEGRNTGLLIVPIAAACCCQDLTVACPPSRMGREEKSPLVGCHYINCTVLRERPNGSGEPFEV